MICVGVSVLFFEKVEFEVDVVFMFVEELLFFGCSLGM